MNNANHQGSQEVIREAQEPPKNINGSNIIANKNKHLGDILASKENSKSRTRKEELSHYSSDSHAESRKSLNLMNPAPNIYGKFDPYLFSPKMLTQAPVNNTFINFGKESAIP